MAKKREGSEISAPQKPLAGLERGSVGGDTEPLLARHGVTPCGRWAYRYDDEGRFFAVRIATPADRMADQDVRVRQPLRPDRSDS